MLTFSRPEQAPLPEARGLETIDVTQEFVAVAAGAGDVAEALHRSDLRWHRDVYGQEVPIDAASTLVLQLAAHAWSLVLHPWPSARADPLSADMAATLSTTLGTSSVYLYASDTSGEIAYHRYVCGAPHTTIDGDLGDETDADEQIEQHLRALGLYLPALVATAPPSAHQPAIMQFAGLMRYEVDRLDVLTPAPPDGRAAPTTADDHVRQARAARGHGG